MMGDKESKMKSKSMNKEKSNEEVSEKIPPSQKSSKKNKILNGCEVHENELFSCFCTISDCRAILCPKCYKTHTHRRKEDLSENLVARFQFQKFLGKGGCGRVFSVIENFEEFAIKVIDVFSDVDENMSTKKKNEYLEDFKTEIQIHQNLRQQYIISYYDNFYLEDEERLVIKMELADGSLAASLENLDKNQALIWFAQILSAVYYLHSKNIIHRDLKPGNILIKENKVKICDFGGAKIIEKTRNSRIMQNKEFFLGTTEYLAPEIFALDVKRFTKSTDIWALGIILFKMLNNGKHPFESSDEDKNRDERIEEIKKKMDEYKENKVKLLKKVTNLYMGDIIGKCLQYDADERIDIKSLISDFKDKLNEEGIDISIPVKQNPKSELSEETLKPSKIKSKTVAESSSSTKGNSQKFEESKYNENSEKSSNSETSENINSKANKLFLQEKYEEALKEYEQAIKLNPSAKYHCNKASCLIRLNRLNEAMQSVNKCLQMDPKFVKGYARKGKILLMQKDFDSATKTFQQGLDLDKSNQDCLEGIASCSDKKMMDAYNLHQRAEEFYIEGKFKDALNEILEAIIRNSQVGIFYMTKSKILFKLKDYNGALIAAKKSVDLDSSNSKESYEIQAESLLNLKRYDEAVVCYNALLKLTPNNTLKIKANLIKVNELRAEELYEKSNNNHSNNNYGLALDFINKAIDMDPSSIKFYLKKAKIQDDKNDKQDAIQTLGKVLDLDKGNAQAYILLGKICLDLKLPVISMAILSEGVKLNPYQPELKLSFTVVSKLIEDAAAINKQGVAYYDQGNWMIALQKFNEAINLNPQQATFHYNLANTLIKIDDFDGALQSNKKCIEVDKNFVLGYSQQGAIFLKVGKKQLAEQAFKQGLEIDPHNERCREGLRNMNGNQNEENLLGLLLLGALMENNRPPPQHQAMFFINRNKNSFFDF